MTEAPPGNKSASLPSRFIAWNRRMGQAWAKRFPRFFAHPSYRDELVGRVQKTLECEPEAVLEVGGADRPLLARGQGYRYDGLDIDGKEECYRVYDQFSVQSVEDEIKGPYGLVISFALLEHVPDNGASIGRIFDALTPGGDTHHYIPSKGHPYALALRLVGPALQRRLIRLVRPTRAHVTGYPTFFDRCSVREMGQNFRDKGFVDVDVRPFYRANDYFAFFLPAFLAVTAFENVCRSLGWTYFASGFVISGRKPTSQPAR
jgi:hypothetical protein